MDETPLVWDQTTRQRFDRILEKIPVFMRCIAQEKVSKKAEALVRKEGRAQVTDKDLVDAFFAETPFGFHGPMKTDMETVGLDYTQYGYD